MAALAPVAASAQTASAPANASANAPPPQPPKIPKDIPFPVARGGPLQIPIDGLRDGSSRIGAGMRQFGLCWAGGTPPYSLNVTAGDARKLLFEHDIATRDLQKSSDFEDLQPGAYGLTVSDGAGERADGRFLVVPPSDIPGATTSATSGGEALAEASDLLAKGPAFDYEAYLRLVPLSLGAGNAEAQRMLDRICHRETTAPPAASAPPGNPEAELALSDEVGLSAPDFDSSINGGKTARVYTAYLTEQGELFAQLAYDNGSFTHENFSRPPNPQQVNFDFNVEHTTPMVEYGVTDDLAVGGEISYAAFSSKSPHMSSSGNGWTDPTFLGVYRVLDGVDFPATVFVRASYSPVTIEGGDAATKLGTTVVRSIDRFTLAGFFDATYHSPFSASAGQAANGAWIYVVQATLEARVLDRLQVALSPAYQFSFNSSNTVDTFGHFETRQGGIAGLVGSLDYDLVPGRIVASFTYQRNFGSSSTSSPILPDHPYLVRIANVEIFGIALRGAVSITDLLN